MTASVSVGRIGSSKARHAPQADLLDKPASLTRQAQSGHPRLPATLAAVLAAIGLFVLSAAPITAQDATATPAVTPAPDAPRLELEFEELNDSGVSGTATLYESGSQTIVELSLEDTGENHPAHIHAGSCDDLQPEPEYPLQNVGSDGRSTSVVNATLADLIAGDFAIDLHLSPNELGTLIVCANIEGEPTVPPAVETPGATPGTPTVAATQPLPTATLAATQTPAPTEAAVPTPAPTEATQTPRPLVVVATRAVDAVIAASARAREAVVARETDGDETPDVTEPAVTATPGEAEATATEDLTNAPDGTGGAVNDSEGAASAPLPGTGDPEVDGTVVLTMLGADTTRISVVLSGDAVTNDAIVHLHDGTCDAPGDYTLDLDPFDADGKSETDVDLSLDDLLADGYFINVHQSEPAYDTLLVCGELSDATVGMVMPENPTPEAGSADAITPEPAADPTPAPADTTPVAEATTAPENETPVPGKTIVTTPAATETPAAMPAPAKGDVTGDGTAGDVADAGSGSGKGSPVQAAGDGTSGDVTDAGSGPGSGSPVDPTTGLPRTTGTGPLLRGDAAAIDWAAWLSGALALLALGAGIQVRRVETQRSRSNGTVFSRHASRWTLPDI